MKPREIVVLAIIVSLTVLLAMDKISVEHYAYILLLIISYYLGYAHGARKIAGREEIRGQ